MSDSLHGNSITSSNKVYDIELKNVNNTLYVFDSDSDSDSGNDSSNDDLLHLNEQQIDRVWHNSCTSNFSHPYHFVKPIVLLVWLMNCRTTSLKLDT